MSFAILTQPNSFELYCSTLNAREVISGDITIPDALIDTIRTDRIFASIQDQLVFDLRDPDAKLAANLIPSEDNAISLGSDDNQYSSVHTHSLIGPKNGVVYDPVVCNAIQFQGLNNSPLSKFLEFSGQLPIEGAMIGTAQVKATLIGNYVNVSIEFPSGVCTANTISIDIVSLPPPFRPIHDHSCSVRVQTDSLTYSNDGLLIVDNVGDISIYAGETVSSFFTISHSIGLGYPGGTYFSFGYHIN